MARDLIKAVSLSYLLSTQECNSTAEEVVSFSAPNLRAFLLEHCKRVDLAELSVSTMTLVELRRHALAIVHPRWINENPFALALSPFAKLSYGEMEEKALRLGVAIWSLVDSDEESVREAEENSDESSSTEDDSFLVSLEEDVEVSINSTETFEMMHYFEDIDASETGFVDSFERASSSGFAPEVVHSNANPWFASTAHLRVPKLPDDVALNFFNFWPDVGNTTGETSFETEKKRLFSSGSTEEDDEERSETADVLSAAASDVDRSIVSDEASANFLSDDDTLDEQLSVGANTCSSPSEPDAPFLIVTASVLKNSKEYFCISDLGPRANTQGSSDGLITGQKNEDKERSLQQDSETMEKFDGSVDNSVVLEKLSDLHDSGETVTENAKVTLDMKDVESRAITQSDVAARKESDVDAKVVVPSDAVDSLHVIDDGTAEDVLENMANTVIAAEGEAAVVQSNVKATVQVDRVTIVPEDLATLSAIAESFDQNERDATKKSDENGMDASKVEASFGNNEESFLPLIGFEVGSVSSEISDIMNSADTKSENQNSEIVVASVMAVESMHQVDGVIVVSEERSVSSAVAEIAKNVVDPAKERERSIHDESFASGDGSMYKILSVEGPPLNTEVVDVKQMAFKGSMGLTKDINIAIDWRFIQRVVPISSPNAAETICEQISSRLFVSERGDEIRCEQTMECLYVLRNLFGPFRFREEAQSFLKWCYVDSLAQRDIEIVASRIEWLVKVAHKFSLPRARTLARGLQCHVAPFLQHRPDLIPAHLATWRNLNFEKLLPSVIVADPSTPRQGFFWQHPDIDIGRFNLRPPQRDALEALKRSWSKDSQSAPSSGETSSDNLSASSSLLSMDDCIFLSEIEEEATIPDKRERHGVLLERVAKEASYVSLMNMRGAFTRMLQETYKGKLGEQQIMELTDYRIEAGRLPKISENDDTPVMLVMATGVGKTLVLCLAPFMLPTPPGRVLVVAPNATVRSLLKKSFLEKLGTIDDAVVVIELSKKWSPAASDGDIFVANIQRLQGDFLLECFPRNFFDLIMIDEAHHAEAKSYRLLREHFLAPFLYVTATPFRGDGKVIDARTSFEFSAREAVRDGLIKNVAFVPVPVESMSFSSHGDLSDEVDC
jgi:hypothetical protein